MEDLQKQALQASKENALLTIQPGDQFIILVSAKDNNVVKPFNQNYATSETPLYSGASTNVPTQTQVPMTGPTYVVSTDYSIDFPVIGAIEVKNKTVESLKLDIISKIKRYVKEPSVSIRLVNFKISVLGEVNKSGRYTVPDGQNVNVLEAIAMAGDMTIYAERNKIMLIRNVDGTPTSQIIDVSTSDFINSPYYYMKQNDIVVVPANKTRQNASMFGPETTIWISVASVAIGLLALFIKR
jgi:polysaccharide export outer membrane protein